MRGGSVRSHPFNAVSRHPIHALVHITIFALAASLPAARHELGAGQDLLQLGDVLTLERARPRVRAGASRILRLWADCLLVEGEADP
jgi:hypothetical protein